MDFIKSKAKLFDAVTTWYVSPSERTLKDLDSFQSMANENVSHWGDCLIIFLKAAWNENLLNVERFDLIEHQIKNICNKSHEVWDVKKASIKSMSASSSSRVVTNFKMKSETYYYTDDHKLASAYKLIADAAISNFDFRYSIFGWEKSLREGSEEEALYEEIIPILFLYRHSLELIFKEYLRLAMDEFSDLKSILEINDDELGTHRLSLYWKQIKLTWEHLWPDAQCQTIKNVNYFINHLDEVDNNGQMFRYSTSKDSFNTTQKKIYDPKSKNNNIKSIDWLKLKESYSNIYSAFESTKGVLEEIVSENRAFTY